MGIMERYTAVKIIPVAVVENEKEIRCIADLCSEYLPSLELTMRTPYALEALKILKKDYPSLAVAAATILSPELADKVVDTGTEILISPGFTPELIKHCKDKNYVYIPGVSTPAEIEQCLLAGYRVLKMFHAEVIGGINWLKAVEGVYKHTGVKFIPLGGLTYENVKSYLNMSNVISCGGSWIVPKNFLEAGDWNEIKNRFIAVSKLIKEIKS